jgi:hypothetical protein
MVPGYHEFCDMIKIPHSQHLMAEFLESKVLVILLSSVISVWHLVDVMINFMGQVVWATHTGIWSTLSWIF